MPEKMDVEYIIHAKNVTMISSHIKYLYLHQSLSLRNDTAIYITYVV